MVTERGRAMEAIRELRGELERAVSGVAALRDRVFGAYGAAREAGASWVGAALEALKAVEAGPSGAGKDLGEASRAEMGQGSPGGVAASGEREQVAKSRDGSEVGDLFAAHRSMEGGRVMMVPAQIAQSSASLRSSRSGKTKSSGWRIRKSRSSKKPSAATRTKSSSGIVRRGKQDWSGKYVNERSNPVRTEGLRGEIERVKYIGVRSTCFEIIHNTLII